MASRPTSRAASARPRARWPWPPRSTRSSATTGRRRSSRTRRSPGARCARWPATTAWTRRRSTRRSTCARSRRVPLPPEFGRIEAYYDAAPRSAARTEEIGPFTLFVGEGPWPYYARPRLGGEGPFTAADVEAVGTRQRELGLPESLEWVHEVTPGLISAVRAVGLEALAAPLMVMEEFAAPRTDPRVR